MTWFRKLREIRWFDLDVTPTAVIVDAVAAWLDGDVA
jgi:hypothetical protein